MKIDESIRKPLVMDEQLASIQEIVTLEAGGDDEITRKRTAAKLQSTSCGHKKGQRHETKRNARNVANFKNVHFQVGMDDDP